MEIRCLSLVKDGLTSERDVFEMDFESFERLESFSIMTNKIEGLYQANIDDSQSRAQDNKQKALSIKNDGTYTRG